MRFVTSVVMALTLWPIGAMAQDDKTLADIRQELTVLYVEVQRLRRELSTTGAPSVQTGGDTVLDRIAVMESELQRLTSKTEELEFRLNFLATVGSTSPYIGLFGTVWGIMTSFHQLANVNQATIAMVAPGISEALIATAMGLFAAIPAVIAFNRFSNQVERLEVRYDNFKEEFSSILQRQAHLLAEE